MADTQDEVQNELDALIQGMLNKSLEENPYIVDTKGSFIKDNPTTGLPEEICTLEVNGLIFEDWESVWIQWEWTADYAQFRFTAAEREPYPEGTWPVLQFEPGDECDIYLGGIHVISGVILTRQVGYDDNNHAVQLQGVSATWYAARSSILDSKSDFNGKTFLQIMAAILAPTGVKYQVLGQIDQTPFDSGASPSPGETISQFMDRLARDRKVIISSTPQGEFLFVAEHIMPIVGDLVEGANIKKMQCIISAMDLYHLYETKAQSKANDQKNGRAASEMHAYGAGGAKRYSAKLTVIEHPVWSQHEVEMRNNTEIMWNESTIIEANITVYGWFRPTPSSGPSIAPRTGRNPGKGQEFVNTGGHVIWMAGDEANVYSPMALLDMVMKIQTVTWTQDNQRGTETLLKCVPPWGLNSKRYIARKKGQAPRQTGGRAGGGGFNSLLQPPAPSKTSTAPPATGASVPATATTPAQPPVPPDTPPPQENPPQVNPPPPATDNDQFTNSGINF